MTRHHDVPAAPPSGDRQALVEANTSSAGFTRKSLWALAVLVSVAGLIGYRWSDLLDANGEMDWFLGGIWLTLAILVCWGVRPWIDVGLIATGLVGGAFIETWGTQTGLWRYFTDERPPLWILPAWPIAALGIERLARWLMWLREHTRLAPRLPSGSQRTVYWLVCISFCVGMAWFVRPAWQFSLTLVVMVIMLLVVVGSADPGADLVLFAAGTLLGVFLEYWGTSRQCWIYHTAEVPPFMAVPAHGFAALAFSRVGARLPGKFRQIPCR